MIGTRLLLPNKTGQRVKRCHKYCQQYNDEGDIFLNFVVMCDETWKHFFYPELNLEASYFAFTDKSLSVR